MEMQVRNRYATPDLFGRLDPSSPCNLPHLALLMGATYEYALIDGKLFRDPRGVYSWQGKMTSGGTVV